jgi:hypothetical protein
MNAYLECGGTESIALKGALLLYESRNRAIGVWQEAKLDSNAPNPLPSSLKK